MSIESIYLNRSWIFLYFEDGSDKSIHKTDFQAWLHRKRLSLDPFDAYWNNTDSNIIDQHLKKYAETH